MSSLPLRGPGVCRLSPSGFVDSVQTPGKSCPRNCEGMRGVGSPRALRVFHSGAICRAVIPPRRKPASIGIMNRSRTLWSTKISLSNHCIAKNESATPHVVDGTTPRNREPSAVLPAGPAGRPPGLASGKCHSRSLGLSLTSRTQCKRTFQIHSASFI
jgi:hypothetical protein